MDRLTKALLTALPLLAFSLAIGTAFPQIRRYLRMKRM